MVDLLVRYLRESPDDGSAGRGDLAQRVVVQAYTVLETYLQGDSRKNELYFAQHIVYFSTQYEVEVRRHDEIYAFGRRTDVKLLSWFP